MKPVAVLFARSDSVYKTIRGVDVWDIERDARKWPGGSPVIAHPPCRAWGRLRQFAKPREDEKGLAVWAVDQVRQWGGVLEHPATSTLWGEHLGLLDGWSDSYGFVWPIHQNWFGHRAEKATRLYIVGLDSYRDLPDMPLKLGRATHCIRPTKSYPRLPSVTKAEREHTPPALAEWLVEVARRTCSRAP